ncbi:MAG: winged helix DNA-binding protein [Candidatus Micrarchaeaceae archaeon]
MDTKKGILLFKEKQIRILLALLNQEKQLYISDLAKITGVTYVHTSRFLSSCERLGLISYEKHGKIKTIFLTQKGKDVTVHVQSILDKLKIEEKENKQ